MENKHNLTVLMTSFCTSLFFTALLLYPSFASGQSLSSSVVSSAGETFTGGTHSIDFTLGELSTESYQKQTDFLTQGFLQETEGSTAVEERQINNVQLEIYPNLVSQRLNLICRGELKHAHCEITGIMGETVLNIPVEQSTHTIDVGILKAGLYLLKIRFSDQSIVIKTFIKQ
jgi:hypothetical protein